MRLIHKMAVKITLATLTGIALIASFDSIKAQPLATATPEPAPVTRYIWYDFTVRQNNLLDIQETVEIHAGTQAAAEEIAQQRIWVNEHFDELEIVEAETLKADGRRLKVPRDKIMKQEAANSGRAMFEADVAIRTIIFPHVGPGDRIRYVARYKAKKERYPGGFEIDQIVTPTGRYEHFSISLTTPASLKLHLATKGFRHTKTKTQDSVVHKWQLAPLPYRPYEPYSVSADDRGSYVRVSSFPDINAAGNAFCKRAEPKSKPTPKVARVADEITKGISSRKEQAQVIFNWIASNIRYVSIVLGEGGMVPRPAESILENRYGDCKDHATLMRAMLTAKGIKSEYASINTDNTYKPYKIPMQSFNHVILYLPEFDLYVDPTATRSTFNTLSRNLRDKPVLRCGYGKTTPARVPPASADMHMTTIRAHLNIGDDGKISGKTEITGLGDYAASLRSFMARMERSGSEAVVKPLFDGLNVSGSAHIERRPSHDRSEPYTLKTSFTIHDNVLGEINSMRMIYGPPVISRPFYHLTRVIRAGRTDDFVCYPVTYREHITYTLPKGWTPQSMPKDMMRVGGPAEFSSRYMLRGQTLEVRRHYTLKPTGSVCPAAMAKQIAPVIKGAVRDASERLTLIPQQKAARMQKARKE